MALVALAIKLDSRGPVLFRQKRYGFNNELIEVYKFRSMYVDQTDATAAKLVTKGDPRVTRVGRFIRKTSLDELPQLFNVVFKGNLSLVGPRPHAVHAKAADRLYDEAVDGYFARHRVKPGITGWAQVNGWRGETDTRRRSRRRVEHDLYYIENWSVLFDLYILAMTPFAFFVRRRQVEPHHLAGNVEVAAVEDEIAGAVVDAGARLGRRDQAAQHRRHPLRIDREFKAGHAFVAVVLARLQFEQPVAVDVGAVAVGGGGGGDGAGDDLALHHEALDPGVDQAGAELRQVEDADDQRDQARDVERDDAPRQAGEALADEELPGAPGDAAKPAFAIDLRHAARQAGERVAPGTRRRLAGTPPSPGAGVSAACGLASAVRSSNGVAASYAPRVPF